MSEKRKKPARPVRALVGDAKNPEKVGNYNETIGKESQKKAAAYEANTTRMRQSECLPKHEETKKGTYGRSDIGSGVVAGSRIPYRETDWEVIGKLLNEIVFGLIVSVLTLLLVLVRMLWKSVEGIGWLSDRLSLLSPAQEEQLKTLQKGDQFRTSMEKFETYREPAEEESNPDSNSQLSTEDSGQATLSSFPPIRSPTTENAIATPLDTREMDPPNPTTMPTLRFPMPVPGSEGMPYFSGANITEFIERFEELCEEYQIEDLRIKLPRYCDSVRREIVKALPEWENKAPWEELVDALKEEFRSGDRYQTTYSMTFLNEYVRMSRTEAELKAYCRQYALVSKVLVARKVLSEVDRGRLFLLGLPKRVREKVVGKFKVDDMKPETYMFYDEFLSHVVTFAKSSQTNQALELQKEPTPAYKQEIRELVEERGEPPKVPEELKKVPPVVPLGKSTVDKAQMDEVVREMAKLRIRNLELDQKISQLNHQNARNYDSTGLNQHPEPIVNVNSLQASRKCLYCWDTAGQPGHWRRDCPKFLSDVRKGVCHLDQNGKICLGPWRENARPASLRTDRSQGDQVRILTAGTEYDANVEQRKDHPQIYNRAEAGGRGSNARQPEQILRNQDRQPLLSRAQEENRSLGAPNIGCISITSGSLSKESDSDDQEHAPFVNAASIDKRGKGRPKAVTFDSSSKITKQRLGRESRYATANRSLRQARAESGTVIEVEEDEDPHAPNDSGDDEMEDVTPTIGNTAPKVKRIRQTKYIDKYTTLAKREEAFDNLMKQKVVLELQDLVALEGGLVKMLGKRLPLVPAGGRSDVLIQDLTQPTQVMTVSELRNCYPTTKVNLIKNIKTVKKNAPGLAMHTAKVEAKIGGRIKTPATIDSGAEVNVMTKATAERAKLIIQTDKTITFQTISGGQFSFFGLCLDVEVDVGGIVNYVDFFIIEDGSMDVLLGMPYFFESQMNFEYPADGSMQAVFKNSDRTRQGVVTVASDEVDLGNESESENE